MSTSDETTRAVVDLGPLEHVLWLGGGSGAGKSTLARRLAYRFDLRLYPVDAYGFAHEARATPAGQPLMTRLASLDYRARKVTPTAREQSDLFVGYAGERFPMVVDDLTALADGPPVVAEGPSLLPELIAPVLTDVRQAVFLLPTPGFTAASLRSRGEPQPTADTAAHEAAHRLRLDRDVLLTARIRRDAQSLGLAVVEVDGSDSPDESEQRLASLFEPLIAHRSRVGGADRAALRRAENAVVNTQLAAFVAYLGDAAPARERPFPYACECTTLGCGATVLMTPTGYRAAGQALGHG